MLCLLLQRLNLLFVVFTLILLVLQLSPQMINLANKHNLPTVDVIALNSTGKQELAGSERCNLG